MKKKQNHSNLISSFHKKIARSHLTKREGILKTMKNTVLAAILKYLSSIPSLNDIGIQQHRTLIEKAAMAFKIDTEVDYKEFQIKNIPAAEIVPRGMAANRTILYFHGGGFVAGSIHSHRDLATRLAKAATARTILFNYRIAPEHRFPCALDDAMAVYQWLLDQTASAQTIAFAGDSAGGGLALSLILKAGKLKLPCPGAAVLISPWVNLDWEKRTSIKSEKNDPLLSPEALHYAARLYAGSTPLSDPMLSPVNADLRGICPLMIHIGTREILLDDALYLAEKAKQAGVEISLKIWEDMFHVWHYFARYLPEGKAAIEELGKFIKTHIQ